MKTKVSLFKIWLLLGIGALILGCAANTELNWPVDKIKPGIDEADVRKLMGLPDYWESHENEKEEIWQYCRSERFKPLNDVVVVWFYERDVTGVETYTNVGFGGCEMFFRKLKWKNAPHRKNKP